jgi:aromatic ring-opening dioxygenase LigB subunit
MIYSCKRIKKIQFLKMKGDITRFYYDLGSLILVFLREKRLISELQF